MLDAFLPNHAEWATALKLVFVAVSVIVVLPSAWLTTEWMIRARKSSFAKQVAEKHALGDRSSGDVLVCVVPLIRSSTIYRHDRTSSNRFWDVGGAQIGKVRH